MLRPKKGCEMMLSEAEINTIRSLARNGLKLQRTAAELNYSRNSILYHVIRIKEKTGLDARNFYDMTRLLNLIKEGDPLD